MAAPEEVHLQIDKTAKESSIAMAEAAPAGANPAVGQKTVHIGNNPPPTIFLLHALSLIGILATLIVACVALRNVDDINNCSDTTNEVVEVVQNYTHITDYVSVCLDGRHNALIGPSNAITGANICDGAKGRADEATGGGLLNADCIVNNTIAVFEQAGANVTVGYHGTMDSLARDVKPINVSYWEAGLCPVNVHWHLGAEHLSVGEYDEHGTGPSTSNDDHHRKLLAGDVRQGGQCHHYDSHDETFTKEYDWQYCVDMHVGETYEVHWPHSALGDCGTPNQYQSPFYDGVFCHLDKLTETQSQIGVQAQVFTIVNDERYYYPDLIRGMIVDGTRGTNMTYYTGSTTGTSRDNTVCSGYAPITWQVDRVCNVISASSFDKMCADMKAQRDDMSSDFYAHGSREVVSHHLAANNQVFKFTQE